MSPYKFGITTRPITIYLQYFFFLITFFDIYWIQIKCLISRDSLIIPDR